MKITVLGGGGVRSMFLAKSIAQKAKRLGIDELCFMDNDEEKLRIYGGMAAHVARLLCPEMRFSLTADPVEAAQDADYVITTIRVGQDEMRAKDERIALDHGVLGQETTGAAGLSFAMRSVPALAAYCELIKKYAKPSVKVFNFTNPAGVVSQTLRDMGYDFTYGICDAPSGMLRSFALLYGANPANITGEVYGLTHLSYFKSITINAAPGGGRLPRNLVRGDFVPGRGSASGCGAQRISLLLLLPRTGGDQYSESAPNPWRTDFGYQPANDRPAAPNGY